MLTNKDFHEIEIALEKLLESGFRGFRNSLKKDLKRIHDTNLENSKNLKGIENKLDKFMSMLNRFSKRQTILEGKMKLIEEYFDPHPRN